MSGNSPHDIQNGERRTSFGFLRRQKSTEAANKGGKMNKKQKGQAAQQQYIPPPPKLPIHNPLPNIGHSFGDENGRPDSYQIVNNSYNNNYPQNGKGQTQHQNYDAYSDAGMHAVPMQSQYQQSHVGSPMLSSSPGSKNGDYHDPYARTESMTHRGRYSYASSAISTATGINSPRRVRRRKDPTPFK